MYGLEGGEKEGDSSNFNSLNDTNKDMDSVKNEVSNDESPALKGHNNSILKASRLVNSSEEPNGSNIDNVLSK